MEKSQRIFVIVSLILVITALLIVGLLYLKETPLEFYGQESHFSGKIEKRIIPGKDLSPEEVWILVLDKPITSLPMPQIGDEKREDQSIKEVILYLSPTMAEEVEKYLKEKKLHLNFKGSIWYADWWSEKMPFLLIPEGVYP